MHRFRIHALADPETLPRVVGAFARRALVPIALAARREGDGCRIEAHIAGLDPQQAAIVAAGLGETFAVLSVECDTLHHGGQRSGDTVCRHGGHRLAGVTGFEPVALGFGDRCSTN